MGAAAALIVAAALLVLVVSPTVQGGSQQARLQVTGRLSKEVRVPPGGTRIAVVKCPRGYLPISGNQFLGVIRPVFDGPSRDGRGWQSAGFLTSNARRSFDFRVGVVCARGARNLTVIATQNADAEAESLRDIEQAQADGTE